jgi:hypothetical protein
VRVLAALTTVLLAGCSTLLGIANPSPAGDGGTTQDVGTTQDGDATLECHPVINELVTGGTTAADEFVEIYNPCTGMVDVTGWTLIYRAASATTGTADTRLMATLADKMMPGDFRVYVGIDFIGAYDGMWPDTSGIMQQMSGAVALRNGAKDVGTIIDALAYGTVTAPNPFIENKTTGTMANGKSASRLPNGHDTNDNSADFTIVLTPTPRATNVP